MFRHSAVSGGNGSAKIVDAGPYNRKTNSIFSTITLIKRSKYEGALFQESWTIILYQKDQRVTICTHTDQNLVIGISQTI